MVVALLAFSLSSCEEKVKVKTGMLRVCKYGEVIEDNTKTLKVAKSEAKKYSVSKNIELCDKHRKIESLYRTALEAEASGEEAQAREAIEKAARQDPSLKPALKESDSQKQLSKIADVLNKQAKDASRVINKIAAQPEASQSVQNVQSQPSTESSNSLGGASGSSSDSDQNQGQNQGQATAIDPKSLLPASILGYESGPVNWGDDWANRDFLPPKGKGVESALVEIIVTQSSQAAQDRVNDVHSKLYYSDGESLKVKGGEAHFGTNETNYASLAYAQGKVVFTVLLLTGSGNPVELKSETVSIAEQIP